jgi:hypothetical protein
MSPRPRAGRVLAWIAFRSAWSSRGMTRDDDFAALLRPPVLGGGEAAGCADDARRATRLAFRSLLTLARIPRAGWRYTCLFRAISECLVLRALGLPAVVKLGVRGGANDPVWAHAWAECAGIVCLTSSDDADHPYTPLQ